MRPHTGVRGTTLVIVALLMALVSWVLLGPVLNVSTVAQPTWIGIVVMVFLGGGLVVAGWQVKQYRDGKATRMLSPLRSARTLVLGQAGALTGAVLIGWYTANVLILLPDSDIASQRDRIWLLVGHILAAVLLSLAGMLVQWWCRLRPGGERDDRNGRDHSDDGDEADSDAS